MKKSRYFALASVFAMSSVLVSGGTMFAARHEVTSSVAVSMYGQSGNGVANLNTNWFTHYAENHFGMKIQWVLGPASDITEKQSLLLASGDYPDIFFNGQFTPAEVLQYGQEGIFVPLNKYIKKYAPNVWKAIQTAPGYKQAAMAPNGKIYALPAYNYCLHCDYPGQIWIDSALFKKFGVAVPTGPVTTTQFEHILQVFKSHGIIPYTTATQAPNSMTSQPIAPIMNAFVYDNGTNFLDVSNDRVSFAPTSQAWLQGLKFIHGLFVKGLISSEIFTQTGDTVQSEVNDGDVAMVAAHSASDVVANYGVGTVWKDWLGTLPVLRGPKGVEYTRFAGNQPTGETFAITNKATLPQIRAVMKLLNFMYTPDGQQIEDFGPAGIYWTYAKKGQKGLTGQQALFNTDWNKFYGAVEPQNYGWNTMGPMYQSEVWRNGGLALPYNTPDGSQTDLQLEAELHYEGHQPAEVYPGVVWVPPKDAQTYAFDETNIDDYVNEWTADFVTGAKPLSDWTTYVAGLKKLGLSQYLTLSQRYMGKPFNTSAFKPVPAQIKFLESDH